MRKPVLLFFLFTALLFESFRLPSPKLPVGVFFTPSDLMTGKISPALTDSTTRRSIRVWGTRFISVREGHTLKRYAKDSVYAYRNAQGDVYRIWSHMHVAYKIEEIRTISIYTLQVPVYGAKMPLHETKFFFSTHPDSEIGPLTVLGVKRAFPHNFALHHYLDLYCNEGNIADYDNEQHTYQINYILSSFTNNTTIK